PRVLCVVGDVDEQLEAWLEVETDLCRPLASPSRTGATVAGLAQPSSARLREASAAAGLACPQRTEGPYSRRPDSINVSRCGQPPARSKKYGSRLGGDGFRVDRGGKTHLAVRRA